MRVALRVGHVDARAPDARVVVLDEVSRVTVLAVILGPR
jgi:hypothetical protein